MSFRKHRAGAPAGFFACEAARLALLDVPGGPRVVRVVSVSTEALELERLQPAAPSREAAHAFGSALARLHDAGAPCFGAPPQGWGQDGFFGPLDQPLPLPRGNHQRWGEFYAQCRLDQVRDLLAARGRLSTGLAADLARVHDVHPRRARRQQRRRMTEEIRPVVPMSGSDCHGRAMVPQSSGAVARAVPATVGVTSVTRARSPGSAMRASALTSTVPPGGSVSHSACTG